MDASRKQQAACAECTQKCLRKHHNHSSPPPIPTPFFKIMLGDFAHHVFIPPMFSQMLGDMINRNVYLKDSTETVWTVTLSDVNGLLVFDHGWCDFVSAHSISLGEMLTFKHTGRTYFSVRIFGTTGVERVNFGKEKVRDSNKIEKECNPINRGKAISVRSSEESGEEYGFVRKQSKKERVTNVNEKKAQVIMIDDESDDEHVKRGKIMKASTSKGKRKSSAEEFGRGGLVSNYFLTKKRKSSTSDKLCMQETMDVTPMNLVNLEELSDDHDSLSRSPISTKSDKVGLTGQHLSRHEEKPPTLNCVTSFQDKEDFGTKEVEPSPTEPENVMEKSSQPGLVTGEAKETCDKTASPCADMDPVTVKVELKEKTDVVASPSYANFKMIVSVIFKCRLLLPRRLPAGLLKKRHSTKGIVVLRGPTGKASPVLYRESFYFRGFTVGWEDFATLNNLKIDDTCEIEIEAGDESEQPVFSVRIV